MRVADLKTLDTTKWRTIPTSRVQLKNIASKYCTQLKNTLRELNLTLAYAIDICGPKEFNNSQCRVLLQEISVNAIKNCNKPNRNMHDISEEREHLTTIFM